MLVDLDCRSLDLIDFFFKWQELLLGLIKYKVIDTSVYFKGLNNLQYMIITEQKNVLPKSTNMCFTNQDQQKTKFHSKFYLERDFG